MSLRELIKARLQVSNIWYEEPSGSSWIKIKCLSPNHIDQKPSAGINVDSGIAHCFSCGHNSMFIKQDDTNPDDADVIWKAKYTNMKKTMQDEYANYDSIYETLLDRDKEIFLPTVDHYLDEEWRGLSAELLQDCKAYYCSHGKYSGRYVFPFYMNEQLYGFDARIVDSLAQMLDAKWIRNRGAPVKSLVYPRDVLVKRFASLDHIVIAEGVADALSYIQMGVPAIASFGLTPPNNERIEELIRLGVMKVTLAFDNDAAGMAGMLKVLPMYAEWFQVVPHPMVNMVNTSGYKDANDFLVGIKTNGLKQTTTYEEEDDY